MTSDRGPPPAGVGWRLRRLRQHLDPATTAVVQLTAPCPSSPPRLLYTESSPAAVVAALRTEGCALLRGVLSPAEAAHMAALLAGYEPENAVEVELHSRDASRCQIALLTLFQRDPVWLRLVDPSPVIEAMDELLAHRHGHGSCHLVTMKGWRNRPGFSGAPGAQPGREAGGFHTDELWLELPEGYAGTLEPPDPLICTALTYLSGAPPELCPTRVIPHSFRSFRRPEADEVTWRGHTPLHAVAAPGDTLVFRSDVWHASGTNVTQSTRLCVEAAYGARKVAQKFWPYLDFVLEPRTRAAASAQQLRVLGEHPLSNYG
jgi:hypothetical protein